MSQDILRLFIRIFIPKIILLLTNIYDVRGLAQLLPLVEAGTHKLISDRNILTDEQINIA